MMNRRTRTTSRSRLAAQFDALTLAALVVLLLVAAGAVAQIGADKALARVGCGLNGAVNDFLAYPRPCR